MSNEANEKEATEPKICPLRLNAGDSSCQKDHCEWWTSYQNGGACAVWHISRFIEEASFDIGDLKNDVRHIKDEMP